ncbi:hypothetical protein HHL11_00420 [Ramlibacter sp. G-1-2-2]|uniref:Transporter n=1 Tax=Ramlibacter agri TaxID=2728837 RepID=A0A848GXN8_9BURK|nr:hypothetical protein [Ramlibacter agri]NML42191.1 hypothetical protein [Ramlibacter agri]
MKSGSSALAAGLALCLAAGSARAAGGHHSVDDATIAPPGQCVVDTWVTRYDHGGDLGHAGANCRAGPVELGLATERFHPPGEPGATTANLELKWVHEVAAGVSVGVDAQPFWRVDSGVRHAATQAYGIVTWTPHEAWAFHANYGRNFLETGRDTPRGGVAAEWLPTQRWSYVLERYFENETQYARAGARWTSTQHWNLDVSRAQRLAGKLPSSWTLGLTFELGAN